MITAAHSSALNGFFDVFTGETAEDLARKLNCTEVDALAKLMSVFDRDRLAAEWINAHSHADEDGDQHHRTPGKALRYELDQIAATFPSLELREEDPETFGRGHLVLYRGDSEFFALTEYNDQPDDDTNVSGWDWEQAHHSPSGGPLHTDASGRHESDDLDDLTRLVWEWATH
jgi:hypothetical protein